jgi:hypothetical protein
VGRDAALAVRIATQLGLPVEPLETLRAGSVNYTFVVGHDVVRCVIRFAVRSLSVDEFVTEAWCLRLAAAHGIASPAVVAVGTLEGVPAAVHRFVPHLAPDAAGSRHVWEDPGPVRPDSTGSRSLTTRRRLVHPIPAAIWRRRGRPTSPSIWPSSRRGSTHRARGLPG